MYHGISVETRVQEPFRCTPPPPQSMLVYSSVYIYRHSLARGVARVDALEKCWVLSYTLPVYVWKVCVVIT